MDQWRKNEGEFGTTTPVSVVTLLAEVVSLDMTVLY